MPDSEYRPSSSSFRLARSSIGVLLLAILVSVVAGLIAFFTSRRAVMDSVAQESLAAAHSIVNELEFDLKSQDRDLNDRKSLVHSVAKKWSRTEPPVPGSYLCVIEHPGRIALHTANSAMSGKDVSNVIVNPGKPSPRTVLDLLQAKQNLATQNRNFQGKQQLAGYAYFPSLDSLLVVHVPAKFVESQVRKTALPWALALALVAMMLIPLSIGLSHLGYRSTERTARLAWIERRKSQQQFRAIFNSTFQFIGLLSTDGTLLQANDSALQFGGRSREEVIGKRFWETSWWEGNEDRVRQLKDAIRRAAAGEFVRYPVEVDGVHGAEIIDFTLKPVFGEAGDVEWLVPEGRLITEQKTAEIKLAESEARLRSIIDAEPECVKVLAVDGTLQNMNRVGLKMIEADSLEQVANQSIFPLIEPEFREAFRAMHQRVIAGETAQLEFEIRGLKGRRLCMDTHASPLRDSCGQIIGHLAITRDITDRKLEQQQLRFTQFSVDSCSSPIFWIRADASFFYVNDAAARDFGYDREELLAMKVQDIDPSYSADVWPEYWAEVQRHKSLAFESEMQHKDGTRIPVEIKTNLFEFQGLQYLFAFVHDNTERKAAENLVRANEARFRALVENSYDVISMFSSEGRILYASPSISRVLGYASDEIWNIDHRSLLHPDETETVAPLIRQLMKSVDSVVHGILRLRHKLGSYRTVEFTATNLLDEPGVNAIVTIFRDITEKAVAEERLRERESQLAHVARISTIGEIAAGIAHEIKQPLHAVANFSTAAALALQSDAFNQTIESELVNDFIEWNQGIKTAAQRATEIVQRLRNYSRKTGQQVDSVEVAVLFDEAIDLIAFETRRYQIGLEVQIPEGLPNVECDRIQVQQVLVNLLRNAQESLKHSHDRERQIWLRAKHVPPRVQLQISDNGPGVDPDIRGRIFDAFYTTKLDGIGMGLAISRTIVENHGGQLIADVNAGGGATFAFTLPVPTESKLSLQEPADAV